MKLNELRIIKPHISDGLFIKYVAKKFLENGFNIIGRGMSAFVFTKDDIDHVYKIYNYDDAYYEFARYCIENPNKHLPKLKLINLSNSNFGIVKIEKLKNHKENNKIENFIDEYRKHPYSRDSELPKELENSSYKEEHLFLLKLRKIFSHSPIDIHSGNIMIRDNGDLVFTDIFANLDTKNDTINQAITHIKDFFDKDNKTKNELNVLAHLSDEPRPNYINLNNNHHEQMPNKFVDEYFNKFGYITSNMYLKTLKNYKIKENKIFLNDIKIDILPEMEAITISLESCETKEINLKNIKEIRISRCNIPKITIINSHYIYISRSTKIENLNYSDVNIIELSLTNIINTSVSCDKTTIHSCIMKNVVINKCTNLWFYSSEIDDLHIKSKITSLYIADSKISKIIVNGCNDVTIYSSEIDDLNIKSKISSLHIANTKISKILITKKVREECGDKLNNYENIIEYIS